jgi:hypothetical protein
MWHVRVLQGLALPVRGLIAWRQADDVPEGITSLGLYVWFPTKRIIRSGRVHVRKRCFDPTFRVMG